MTDTIADLCNRINNARKAGLNSINIPYSNMKMAILEVLKDEGYILSFKSDKNSGSLIVELQGSRRTFENIVRLSKPGRRLYVKAKNIPRPKGGYGSVIVSTPRGVLSGEKAKRTNLGGELICEVF